MLEMRDLFYFILLHLIIATPQINLYFSDLISESESDNAIQHDCLRVAASIDESNVNRQIISYCISESLLKYNIEKNDQFPKFTFLELSKQNVTSQQLYLWSTPIDIIEHYQFYLNQLSTSNDSFLETKVIYNCTLPRFGSICQYEFDYYDSNYSFLYQMIHDFYHYNEYKPSNLTCYTHLQCDRGPLPSCLDWSEICDGKFDCRDGQFDEEYCLELEINECKDDEYRCMNGQCIPQSFYLDDYNTPDCLDQSDEYQISQKKNDKCAIGEPSFRCEDITCKETSLTSSCIKQREQLLIDALFSIKDNFVSNDCWFAFKCITNILDPDDENCSQFRIDEINNNFIEKICPDMIFIPAVPVLFNDIYFAYTKNDSQYLAYGGGWFPYTCYNNSRYDEFFFNISKIIFNNVTCYRSENPFWAGSMRPIWQEAYVMPVYRTLIKYTLISNYTAALCNRSNMYQCIDSPKCISIYRLMDGLDDCPYSDDEDFNAINNTEIIQQIIQNYFKCQASNKYISNFLIANDICDCGNIEPGWCEDESPEVNYIRRNISFQTVCDGFTELSPIIINGKNETDETECEQWICNNIYTRCDGLWNCPHGEDEAGCDLSSSVNCSSDEHICVSPHTNQLMCLPMTKVNDGKADCLGGFDEPNLYRRNSGSNIYYDFYCVTDTTTLYISYYSICDGRKDCIHGDDEQFCNQNQTLLHGFSVCESFLSSIRLDIEQFLCESMQYRRKKDIVYFSLDNIRNSIEDQTNNMENIQTLPLPLIDKFRQEELRCHRGLDLRVWLDSKNNSTTTCICPPSYYGNQCQYQNERVSLSIQFRASSHSWQIPFAIIISLIDDSDERVIHSYEQFTYLSMRDCQIKFNIYLLYSTKPKKQTNNYAIHIDIYEKFSLNYRGSLFIPITFSFLPVHRLAFIIEIPRDNNNLEGCLNHQCNHGKCIKYSNNPQNLTFCQCDQGWSGRYCTIPHRCICSSDSLCIGVTTTNNRSVCVCPLHRFGPRCLLSNLVCQTTENSTCKNGGQCIPNDEYIESNQKFTCICRKGFIGKTCEIVENQIILTFGEDIMLTQSIFIHFIQVINNNRPRRSTTLRTIGFKQDSIIIHWSQPFHLVFIEFLNRNYYLAIVQKNYKQSITIDKTINLSDRCPHINEIFSENIVQLHLLRRIKYYQLPCQISSLNLSCFYDDIHLCLCQDHGQQRVANCFEFNHNMTFDCLGQSVCENGAQCFQDTPNCPQRSICVCPNCYYGSRCQFSTNNGLGLSLDAILAYQIQPNIKITQQPHIVKISIAFSIIFIIVGFVNGIISMITFMNKSICEVGCGLYLLGSSIATLLITVMFGLKFWILLVAQMGFIVNRSFLSFQCHSIDFFLRCCLNIDQWLNAFVAIERATTAIKGTRFSKRKSKQAAKIVITIIIIFVVGTNIQDPIYRRLIDEENEDEKRILCIVSYSSNLRTFNSVMHTLHFIVPFLCNLISVIILITEKSRQLFSLQNNRNFKQVLREQIAQHKHLFIAPIVLVILAVPRLIISFASKCIKSSGDSWLFLAGYFISFIPPMVTFVVFILPSKFYMKELSKRLVRYRSNMQKYLYPISQRLTGLTSNRIRPL